MVNIRFEPLSYMIMNGLLALTQEAHAELEHEHRDHPYSPDWEEYQRSENNDGLRFVALRENQKLIGYAVIVLIRDVHHFGLMLGVYRDLFVTKSKRGYAASFVRYIDKQLGNIGANRTLLGERLTSGNEAGNFYKAIGYEPQELIHGKNLIKECGHETRH